jgi:predicted RNase H-like HicB family nuclease
MVKNKYKKVNFDISLPVSFIKEGKYFIAYTPLLDISTSGKTFEQAKQRFIELVQIFLEELMHKGTLDKTLKELGWERVDHKWTPPTVISQESVEVSLPQKCLI